MIAGVTIDRDRLRRTTALHLLCERARSTPDSVAFRSKHLGIYRERNWYDYARLRGAYARALQSIGLDRGERAAIMGDVCEEWLLCDLAVQSLGAIAYGIYPTASPTEVEYQMRDGGAAFFIAEDQEYVDKILPIADRLPDLKAIVVIDDSGHVRLHAPQASSLARPSGRVDRPELDWLEAGIAALSPEDPAFIVYTSGTTGHPKGALVTHGRHLAATDTVVTQYPDAAREASPYSRFSSHVPCARPRCRYYAASHLADGAAFWRRPRGFRHYAFRSCADSDVHRSALFAEVRLARARRGLNSSRLKRAAYDLAMRVARAHVRRQWDGKTIAAQRALYGALHAMILRPILNKLGFDKLELVVSGGAGLPAETAALWHMYGVNVVEMYGQTEEAGGIIAGQRGPFPRPGNVGTPVEGLEVEAGGGRRSSRAWPRSFQRLLAQR